MKKYFLVLIVFLSCTALAQKELNAYKYIVIPSKFDFQKKINEHGLNMLLKYKFEQLGFETYLDTDDMPKALRTNTCLYMEPLLITKSNMFKTTTKVQLVDCDKKILYTSREGESRAKNIKKSYVEALRKSLSSFDTYKLEYTPSVTNYNNNKPKEAIASSSELNNSLKYNYNKEELILEKTSFSVIEIRKLKTNMLAGKMYISSLKKNMYHISFDGKTGFGYFDENRNLIMEFLDSNNTVQLIVMSSVN